MTGPAGSLCQTKASTGNTTTLPTGADAVQPNPASSTVVELNATDGSSPASADFSTSTATKAGQGLALVDANTYTLMVALPQTYTATTRIPDILLSFDLKSAATAYYATSEDCAGNASGSNHCCFGAGPLTAHVTLQ